LRESSAEAPDLITGKTIRLEGGVKVRQLSTVMLDLGKSTGSTQ